jgi:hypothetical protein
MDARVFQLKMKLALLYLHSHLFERGLDLLEELARREAQLPAGKDVVVLEALADAYIRKGCFQEAAATLKRLDAAEQTQQQRQVRRRLFFHLCLLLRFDLCMMPLQSGGRGRAKPGEYSSLTQTRATRPCELTALSHLTAGRHFDALTVRFPPPPPPLPLAFAADSIRRAEAAARPSTRPSACAPSFTSRTSRASTVSLS